MANFFSEVFIVAAVRTPVGKAKGVFAHTRPDDLLSSALAGVMAKVPEVPLSKIDDVIIGCAMPEGAQGMNVARIAALLAGFPENVPALTINRFCSSGLQAISMAADRIALGQADLMVAGGVESMSMVPMGGYHYSANPRYVNEPKNTSIAYSMGITAERVAKKWQINREEQDKFALASHTNALLAIKNSEFNEQIIPITAVARKVDLANRRFSINKQEITTDQGPRSDTNIEALAKLKPVFAVNGTVTAGNSSQTSDGAAALLLASKKAVTTYNLRPLACLRGFAVAGVAPEFMGIGPVEAIPKALKQTGITLKELGWIELNEAFAAQSLAVIKELDIDRNKINPCGGAIALGHPLGATGAILAIKLIHGAKKRQIRYGMVTMCIGSGMGAAGIFEIF